MHPPTPRGTQGLTGGLGKVGRGLFPAQSPWVCSRDQEGSVRSKCQTEGRARLLGPLPWSVLCVVWGPLGEGGVVNACGALQMGSRTPGSPPRHREGRGGGTEALEVERQPACVSDAVWARWRGTGVFTRPGTPHPHGGARSPPVHRAGHPPARPRYPKAQATGKLRGTLSSCVEVASGASEGRPAEPAAGQGGVGAGVLRRLFPGPPRSCRKLVRAIGGPEPSGAGARRPHHLGR